MSESPFSRPTAAQVREQLDRILGSPLFANARRLSQFLEFVVSRSTNGQSGGHGDLKESLIGVEVYGRDPSYDPKADSIVRAEASRLRAKLREYYETLGGKDAVRIDLPKGSYSPVFLLAAEPVPEAPAPPVRRFPALWLTLAAAVVLVAGAAVWWWSRGAHRAHSIAVIPLANLSGDRSADGLSDTITDELVRALVGSSEWKVAGRAPNLDLAGPNQMLAPLRQNFRAEVVLSGSYRLESSDVRLNLQLTNVTDGYLLWTRTYHEPLTRLAESSRDLALVAVAELTQKFTGRAAPPRTEFYAQARDAWSTYSERGLEQSLQLFRQAIQAEPGFAPAWAGLADANVRLVNRRGQPTQMRLVDARAAATKALELDDSNAEAHAVLGRILLYEEWNLPGALSQLERAVAVDPVRLSPNILFSEALTASGDMQRAEEVIEAARSRLPPMPDLVFQEGSVFFLARKWERLEAMGRELIALEPGEARGHWLLGLSLEMRGKLRPAIAEFELGLQKGAKDDIRTICALSHAYGLAGDRVRALEFISRYYQPGQKEINRFNLPCCAALYYTSLKEPDKALDMLEKARATGDASFPFVLYDARYDPLRADPRYANLLASLKAVPAP